MIDAQAYILRRTGAVPELEGIQVSDELEKGQVRLKVLYSGLCATQIEEIFASSRNAKFMPHMFGHEGVGVVEAIGPGVETKQVGDKCVIHWRRSSLGLDAEPGRYFSNGQKLNSGKVVTFSTQVVVPENRVSLAPRNISMESASVLGCSLPTGWGSVIRVGEMKHGDVVIVVGLGAVGTSAAQVAIASGASKVIVIEPRGVDPRMKENSNLVHLTELSESTLKVELPWDSGAQVLAIDTSGSSEVIELLLDILPPKARFVLVGMPRHGERVRLNTQKLLDGLRLSGSNGGEFDPASDLIRITRLSKTSTLSDLTQQINLVDLKSLHLAIDLQRSSRKKQVLNFAQDESDEVRSGS